LTSDIESSYEVCAATFKTEHEEATWLIADLGKEPDAAHSVTASTGWAEYLEGRLLRAESRAAGARPLRSSRTP